MSVNDKDIFTGYIDINGKHIEDGLKNPPAKGILVSDGNPNWKKRKFYEQLAPELGEAKTITVGRSCMVVYKLQNYQNKRGLDQNLYRET